MNVKELCLKLVELYDNGLIKDETPVHFLMFDTKEYRDFLLANFGTTGAGYDEPPTGEDFFELVTELELKQANISEVPNRENIQTIVCLS